MNDFHCPIFIKSKYFTEHSEETVQDPIKYIHM